MTKKIKDTMTLVILLVILLGLVSTVGYNIANFYHNCNGRVIWVKGVGITPICLTKEGEIS